MVQALIRKSRPEKYPYYILEIVKLNVYREVIS